MGNRAECPVCKAYNSNVYSALNIEMKSCPYCEAPHHILKQWANLSEELEDLQEKRINKDLVNQIKEVMAENAILKTKIDRLQNLFGYDREILEPLEKAYKILYNEEEEDDDR